MAYFNYLSKNIYYREIGGGLPVVFLHGNTASSKMFTSILPFYQEDFKVILIDFLGNGQSSRIDEFPPEIWYEQALQTIALIEHLGYKKVHLVGTSGGAWTAVNAALEQPDLIQGLVADSFDGRTLHAGFNDGLVRERENTVASEDASQFYRWCQGDDWEQVVWQDTKTLLKYEALGLPVFHHPLSMLESPILLMGSAEDDMVRSDLLAEYQEMLKVVHSGQIHMFARGGHPALLTNGEQAALVIKKFLL